MISREVWMIFDCSRTKSMACRHPFWISSVFTILRPANVIRGMLWYKSHNEHEQFSILMMLWCLQMMKLQKQEIVGDGENVYPLAFQSNLLSAHESAIPNMRFSDAVVPSQALKLVDISTINGVRSAFASLLRCNSKTNCWKCTHTPKPFSGETLCVWKY